MTTTRRSRIAGLLGLLLLSITAGMAATKVEVNGQPVSFSTTPLRIDSTIMVPMRDIGQALGASVQWDASTQTVTATRGASSVQLTIDAAYAQVNDRIVGLRTAAMIYRGATMVPLGFVSEALGAEVRWSESTQTMSIFTNGTPDNDPYNDRRSGVQAIVIPRGTVIPVTLDRALSSSTSNARNAFSVTIRSNRDGDAEFPRGTQFVGTAARESRTDARERQGRDVSLVEARLPDGSTVPIDGSLIPVDDTTVTRSSDGRLVATGTSRRDERRPIRVVVDQDTEYGVLMNSDVRYKAPQAFLVARRPTTTPYNDQWSSVRTVVIPRGTVIPVTLDRALDSATSTARDAFSVTVRPGQYGDADLPRGTQFVGTAVRVSRGSARRTQSWDVSLVEARLPDGSTVPIEGSLMPIDDTNVTRSPDGRLVATGTSRQDERRPIHVAVDQDTEFGVLMTSDVRYNGQGSGVQTVVIPQGTVIPVSLDRALNSSTSNAGNAFSVTIRPNQDGDAEFPRGTQFVGTAVSVSRGSARQPQSWDVSLVEARLPDGSTVPIEGSLMPIDDTNVTRSPDGRLVATGTSRQDERRPIHVAVDQDTEFGVLMTSDVRYNGQGSSTQTVVIPQGTVIPVSLDRALSPSANNAGDAFSVTIRSNRDGDAEFPRGTQFLGTAVRVSRANARQPQSWDVSLVEARLPDGSRVPIEGSLISLDDVTVTRSPDGRLVTTVASNRDERRPIRVVVDQGTEFGVLMNSDVRYNAPQAFLAAGGPTTTSPYNDRWSSVQAVVIPQGTVIPVSLDRVLSSSASNAGDAFSVTVRSNQDGDAEFPRGTQLLGTVVGVWKADAGRPGMLDLGFQEARLPDGSTVQIDGSSISLDERTVTRSADGRRLRASTEPTSDNRLKIMGILEGIGLLIGNVRDERSIVGGVLGPDASYSYNEYTLDTVRPTDVAMNPGTVFGVRMDREVSYSAPSAFTTARAAYAYAR